MKVIRSRTTNNPEQNHMLKKENSLSQHMSLKLQHIHNYLYLKINKLLTNKHSTHILQAMHGNIGDYKMLHRFQLQSHTAEPHKPRRRETKEL